MTDQFQHVTVLRVRGDGAQSGLLVVNANGRRQQKVHSDPCFPLCGLARRQPMPFTKKVHSDPGSL
jgi:hypothetical protein